MANPPTTETDLEIIGTARKPNISDLRERGLIGLPDPDPEVLMRRAKFESEQAYLEMQVKFHEGETPLSFLRTKINAQQSDNDAMGLNYEKCKSIRKIEVNVEHANGEEKALNVAARVSIPEMADSPVVNEACVSEKAVRVLRDRNPIQLRPYAVERKMYRQMIATGNLKA